MVLDPIPQSLPVHFFGSRPQPPTSHCTTQHSRSLRICTILCLYVYTDIYIKLYLYVSVHTPHEKLHGVRRVSNPATREDLAARTWGVFQKAVSICFGAHIQNASRHSRMCSVECLWMCSVKRVSWMCLQNAFRHSRTCSVTHVHAWYPFLVSNKQNTDVHICYDICIFR